MADRFAGDNIRLIYDVLDFANQQKQKGLLVLIDFEKAFDSISWKFIQETLKIFNFSEDFCKWIKIFTNNIKSCVQVNGMVSRFFNIGRGCRQGDPLSPYIFLLCSELLAHIIRTRKDIRGYSIHGCEIKISQYADDTSLFLDGSENTFRACMSTLEHFSKISGLKMNTEKTKCIWFGSPRPPEPFNTDNKQFEWNPDTFTALGVTFTTDLKNITEINIQSRIRTMKTELLQWSKRNLTPFGKVTVIRSLMLAKIVHILIALPNPPEKQIIALKSMFYNFLWGKKPDKICRKTVTQKLENGGLNMPDLVNFITALKTTWIRRLEKTDATWKSVIIMGLPKINNVLHYVC